MLEALGYQASEPLRQSGERFCWNFFATPRRRPTRPRRTKNFYTLRTTSFKRSIDARPRRDRSLPRRGLVGRSWSGGQDPPLSGDERADRGLRWCPVTVVPHTTALRGSRFEVTVSARYLKAGGFDAQGIVTIPAVRLIRLRVRNSGGQFLRYPTKYRSRSVSCIRPRSIERPAAPRNPLDFR